MSSKNQMKRKYISIIFIGLVMAILGLSLNEPTSKITLAIIGFLLIGFTFYHVIHLKTNQPKPKEDLG